MTRAGLSRRAIPAFFTVLLLVLWAGIGAWTARGDGVAASAGPVASGAQVAAGAGGSSPYSARLLSCRRSVRIEKRVVSVAARMSPVSGGTHLSMRIDLYQRLLFSRHWALRSDVPGLGVWTTPSDPSLGSRPGDVFAYHQAVARLVVPYAYRFRVGFRWRDDAGKIVRTETVTTGQCREPDLRPDLTLPAVTLRPSVRYPGYARYVVEVRNAGRSPARHVVVAGTFPAHAASNGSRTLARLRPGQSAHVSFVAPICKATDPAAPSFAVDPANAIEEADETNNAVAATCPAPS